MNEPLRVLMITSEWPTSCRPHDVPFLVRQVDYLRRAGVQVDVFHFHGAKNPLNYARAWRRARKQLRTNSYDLIHAQFGQSALLAMPKQLPTVITVRGDDVEGIVGRHGQYTVAGFILRHLTRLVARSADYLILVSSHLQRHFAARPSVVIPSGLDLNLFTLMPQSQARERLNLSRSKRLVLFVGNPKDPRKRFDLAQKAVNLVDASLNTEMVVAWDVAHTEIPVFMNACDLLIFTSMHEGSPNVVKEALACNLPVVSVVVGDVPERLKGLTGSEVCADDQPETIAAAINRVLQLPRGTDGRAAAHLLDEEVLTQRVIAVYEQVLNPGRARQPSGRDAEMTTARPVVRDHAS